MGQGFALHEASARRRFEHARAAGRLFASCLQWNLTRVRVNLEDWRRLLRNQAKLRT
jgi:hypothetical protein